MMRIDSLKWIDFDFKEIFSIKRGKRLKTEDQISGSIAYISSTKNNNGIDNYITPPENRLVYKNAITLNNSGSIGYCFYHTYDFVASDHCTILIPKKIDLTIPIFLFLKPIIETMKHKYSFAREMSNNRLKKEKIKLPVDDKGNPNWKFIEKYISNKSNFIIYNTPIIKPKNIIDLYSVKYNWFNIVYNKKEKKGLFEIKVGTDRSKVLDLLEDSIEDNVYEISNTALNNGINTIYTSKKYDNKNTITLATRGNDFKAFYHDYDIVPVVRVIQLKSVNFKLNKYRALFLCTVLEKSSYRFSYGRFLSGKNILKEKIKLPVDSDGNPDWNFMENYIKSLPYSINI